MPTEVAYYSSGHLVLSHQNFRINMNEILSLSGYYTIPFDFSLFWHFWVFTFQLLKTTCVWLKITVEGSVSEMPIRSILLIISDLKWYIHLKKKSLFYISTSW